MASLQGRSQDFSKGEGSHCVNVIVMAFSPRNIIRCLLKKGLQRGGQLANSLSITPKVPFANSRCS